MIKPGQMISIEGPDKAGKTTQINNILKYLDRHKIAAETLKFPQYNDTIFGQELGKFLRNELGDIPPNWVMFTFALDRLVAQPKINSWLADGKWVIFDRYTYSNIYSVAQHPRREWDEKIQYLENLEFEMLRILKPDLNIYLHVTPQVSYGNRNTALKDYQNGQADKFESDFTLLSNVIAAYSHIAAKNPQNWAVVNEMTPDGERINANSIWDLLRPNLDRLIAESKRKR